MTVAVSECPRCGQSLLLVGCPDCGHPNPNRDNVDEELARQALFVAFELKRIAATTAPVVAPVDPAPAAPRLTVAAIEARAALAAEVAARVAETPAVVEPSVVEAPAVVPVDVVTAPAPAPVPAPAPDRAPDRAPSRAAPRPPRPAPPVFDPVAARAQLERRLELGGWFTGAVFAVGGSLWGTNLFWGDIPQTLRPAVVGVGLAVFAAAFIAVGAVLAVRHAGSLAGHVLGLVGRLIAVSSAFPLGLLWREAGPTAVVVDLLVVAALFFAMRFAHGKNTASSSSSKPPTTGTFLFLAGFAIAALAPSTEIGAVLAGGLAIALLRGAIAGRTDDALAGRFTWVDDISAVALCVAALFSDRGAPGSVSAVVGVTLFAALSDTIGRLFEQRPGLFGYRSAARWLVTVAVVIAACGVVAGCLDDERHLGYAAFASALAALRFLAPERLGLPRAFRGPYAGGIALAAGFAVAGLQQAFGVHFDDTGPLSVLVGLLALFASTSRERRAPALGLGERLATLALFLIAVPVAAAAGKDAGAVPSLLVVFALFATDRRAERSVWWCLTAVGVLVMAIGFALEGAGLNGHFGTTIAVGLLAVVVVVALWIRHQRPAWPVVAGSSAVLLWVMGFGLAGVLAVVNDQPGWTVALVAGLTLLITAELVRSVDLSFAGVVVLGSLGALRLQEITERSLSWAAVVVVVVVAAQSFVPQLAPLLGKRVRAVRMLTRGLSPSGRSPRARSIAAFRVAVVGAGMLVVVGLLGRMMSADVVLVLPGVALAGLLLLLRAPTSRMLGAFAFALALGAGDLAWDAKSGADGVVVAGLAALSVLIVGALGAAIARAAKWHLPIVVRLVRRRGRRAGARDPLWAVAALTSLGAALLALTGVLMLLEHNDDDWLVFFMILTGMLGAHAWVLFAGRASQPLVSTGAVLFTGIFAAGFTRALLRNDEGTALLCVLGLVAMLAVYAVLARLMYRGRSWSLRPPWLLEAWPTPLSLRWVSLTGLLTVASSLAFFGLLLRVLGETGTELALRFGPGVVVVAASLIAACAVILWTRRTLGAGLVVCAICGLAGAAFDMTAHAAHWLPKSYGMGEATGATALLVLLLVLNRERGRRLLAAARMALPRSVRAGLVTALVVAVPLLAGLGVILALGDAPAVHAREIGLAGVALMLLVVIEPRPALGWLGTAGVLLTTGAMTALLARSLVGDGVLTVAAAPLWLAAMMAACVLVQTVSARVWACSWARGFHSTRAAILPAVSVATRNAAETAAFPLLVALVGLSFLDDRPSSLALMSTWIGLGFAVVLFSRIAVAKEQTVLAALAQGIALSIYVDLRRRTPWLDDLPGADAIFLLAAAIAFMGLRWVARSRANGSAVARAAEAYAVTLPVLAAALGPSSGARAVILIVGGGLYAVLARSRRLARYELACGVAIVAACMLALAHAGVRAPESYLLPVAFVGTFLARRHRRSLGSMGRSLAVLCHVPLYCTAAWSALRTETFASFAIGIAVTTAGVVYAMRVRDRRSLYAAAAAAAVLVGGRLILAGLDNALLGTLLLAGVGIALLAGMTVFTIKRDAAAAALKGASSRLDHWDDDDDD